MSHQSELISEDINEYLEQHEQKELLRLLTCGSVDDGKRNPNSNQLPHPPLLYDETRDLIILGFEDILRNNSGCDNDFNDAIFYVSANPIEAIERSNLESVKKAIDSDGDGVYDYDD